MKVVEYWHGTIKNYSIRRRRIIGKHASMVQTQLEQVAKSQRELLDEMNNNISDFDVRVVIHLQRIYNF